MCSYVCSCVLPDETCSCNYDLTLKNWRVFISSFTFAAKRDESHQADIACVARNLKVPYIVNGTDVLFASGTKLCAVLQD